MVHNSGETAKRWVDQEIIKGYHMGTGRHWRILPRDLALFPKDKNISVPNSREIGIDFRALLESETSASSVRNSTGITSDHMRSKGTCEDCLVLRAMSLYHMVAVFCS
jgi:hypothetical protein